MSETPQAETGQQDEQVQDQEQVAATDQEESVEYWRAKARQHERRAKDLASQAKRLEEIEEATKSAEQKQAEKIAKAEQRATKAEQDMLRFKIASKYRVGEEDADLFLTGTDEATLIKQAERLQNRDQPTTQRKLGWGSQEGRSPAQSGDPDLAFVSELFGQAG